MTSYVVLVHTAPVLPPNASSGIIAGGGPGWRVVDTVEATSSDAACTAGALKHYEKNPDAARSKFVAVPERSFQPVQVDIDPNPKASISARVSQ